MRQYTIQVDETIMKHLKKFAEPFVDTPNSVLHRLLLDDNTTSSKMPSSLDLSSPVGSPSPELDLLYSAPRALTQILEVVYEVRRNGRSRAKATRTVAKRRGTMPQTILDKYCRQLGQNASDMDRLLEQHDLSELRLLLKGRFPNQVDVIDSFFDLTLSGASEAAPVLTSEELDVPEVPVKRELSRHEVGRLCREMLARHVANHWGPSGRRGPWLILDDGRKILSLFASLSGDRWWYGVTRTYWESWDEKCHLALLMRDRNRCSVVILAPTESAELLSKIRPAQDGQKKINVRIPTEGKTYVQEWPDFSFSPKEVDLGGIDS